jgi:hypothetical protein
MAKRKAARRKAVTSKRKAGRSRSSSKKVARKKVAKRTPRVATRRKAAASKPMARTVKKRAAAVTPAAKRAKKVATKRAVPRKAVARKTPPTKVAAARPRSAPTPTPKPKPSRPPVRTAPGLNRERRVIVDDDIVQSPPSSLDFDRSASAARSGRRELKERYDEHTETSPALTGGDVDADWESAYSVGDEAPGGDNPTPDQDLVDDIGRAVGVEYQDNEELKGEAKIAKRDRNRWELDPASSDDWDER